MYIIVKLANFTTRAANYFTKFIHVIGTRQLTVLYHDLATDSNSANIEMIIITITPEVTVNDSQLFWKAIQSKSLSDIL